MKPETEHFIYAIFVDTPDRTLVKLGRASSIRQRVSEIATGCPYPIRHVYSADVIDKYEGGMREAQMHELYADKRLRGEWFDIWGRIATPEDTTYVERNVYDIARDRLADSVRHARHTPRPMAGGKSSLRCVQLDDLPPKLIMESDGYAIGKAYIASREQYPVTIVTKPTRRLFKTC